MAQNFIESGREQGFLLPPDVRDWLGADHLAWFVIDAVEQMDLSAFYAAYRADGHGRAACEPSLMVAVILFAFATGVRSSRAIERHCREHVAFRVITGNLVPDHVTVARFVCRHQEALSELFTEVLRLCDKAGLVKPGVVSIDGTRIAGSANPDVNMAFEQVAREIVAQTKAADEAEDEEFGEARGDELPEGLRTPEGRREFLRQARQALRRDEDGGRPVQIEESDAEAEIEESDAEAETEEPGRTPTPEFEFDPERITDAGGGRRRWLSEAKRQLEQHRWENPDPIVRSRVERLLLALGRLEADLAAERAGNEAYEAYRDQGRMRDGRRFGRSPDPYQPPEFPRAR
jgi:transposase